MSPAKLTLKVSPDPKSKRVARWAAELADPDVRRWYEAMAIRSQVTASERLRVLARFCDATRTTPADLLRTAQAPGGTKRIADQLQDFVTTLARPHRPEDHGVEPRDKEAAARCAKGHMGTYLSNYVKSLRSFLASCDIGLVRRIVVGDASRTRVEEVERVPTPAELRKVILASTARGKAIVALCGLSGLRPEVLGLPDLSNGLRIGDLPDVAVTESGVRIRRTPAAVRVRRELSKVRKAYVTYLTKEGCEIVRTYLESRRLRGESLGAASPVIVPDYQRGYDARGRQGELRGSPFLGRQGVSKEIRSAFRAVGLQARPYVLRSYFASALLSAQREGLITDLDREFWMGRTGAISARYTLQKALSPKDIEAMRGAFRKAEPFLTTRAVETVPAADLEEARAALVDAKRKMDEQVRRMGERLGALEANASDATRVLLSDPRAVALLQKAMAMERASARRSRTWKKGGE